jgi:2-polyprenyl-3-methyl-5-hydroxy-6-metoxy-1,4-benzoquinol methylase
MSTRCWCENGALEPFSAEYRRCAACETLICTSEGINPTDFYDWEYFHHDQVRRGVPPIETRARTDLFERCVYWLNALTRFVLPPARVLELGSAHGGFVALMRQAGYDAIGLDLSPAIVELARKTFDVPMLTGPIESQASLTPASFDVIVLMDVIEHLPDPVQTLERCLKLLKPDGIVMLQTPCYPAGRSVGELRTEKHQFLLHLSPGEHLHLFSEKSLSMLLERAGAAHREFLPAIFWFYDMFCIASPLPPRHTMREARDEAFSRSVSARLVQALLDGEERYRGLLAKHRQLIQEAREAPALRNQAAARCTAVAEVPIT